MKHARNPTQYTDERAAVVVEKWSGPYPEDVILAEVNALPGLQLNREKLARWANRLDVKRSHVGRVWTRNTVDREAMVRVEWPGEKKASAVLAMWNALPGDRTSMPQLERFVFSIGLKRSAPAPKPIADPVRTGKGIYNSTDEVTIARMIRRGSDAFGDAFAAAGLWFDDHPDLSPDPAVPVQRRGIMTGPDPRTADLIAARVAMAARSRLAVADVGVRGLV